MSTTTQDWAKFVRDCSDDDRAMLWIELAKHWISNHTEKDPVGIIDEKESLLGYFWPEDSEGPSRSVPSDEDLLAECQRRMKDPRPDLSVEEFYAEALSGIAAKLDAARESKHAITAPRRSQSRV